jgi:hypothetical protein
MYSDPELSLWIHPVNSNFLKAVKFFFDYIGTFAVNLLCTRGILLSLLMSLFLT